VFQKTALKIFRSKRDEVIYGWRKLRNEELHNIVKEDEMGREWGEEVCI
jgi:hypothetical protein